MLTKAFEIAVGIENALCADLQPGERDHLLALLGRLRPLDPGRPGVHPGLAATADDTQNGASGAAS